MAPRRTGPVTHRHGTFRLSQSVVVVTSGFAIVAMEHSDAAIARGVSRDAALGHWQQDAMLRPPAASK
jgi:hypothetical protein